MSDIKDYLTISEVSEYLKLPEETVYKYARNGKIPASKVGRYWRFERTLVDNWVVQNSNRSNEDLNILVVDDEPSVLNLMTRWLEETGATVDCVSNGQDAIGRLQVQKYALILLDLVLPAINGVETLKEIQKIAPETDVVIITAYFDSRLMEQAMDLGPLTVLKKPIQKDALLQVVKSHARRGAPA